LTFVHDLAETVAKEVDGNLEFSGPRRRVEMITTERQTEVKRAAEELCARGLDWVGFYREILGPHGVVRRTFHTRESLAEFKQTEAYQEIQEMLAGLRKQGPVAVTEEEPTRVITVRLPKSVHDGLKVEAHEHRISMNKLCISKLLQFIESERVPTDL
jgi:predicted HicB family RNase H-like nuclease